MKGIQGKESILQHIKLIVNKTPHVWKLLFIDKSSEIFEKKVCFFSPQLKWIFLYYRIISSLTTWGYVFKIKKKSEFRENSPVVTNTYGSSKGGQLHLQHSLSVCNSSSRKSVPFSGLCRHFHSRGIQKLIQEYMHTCNFTILN